jgi:hypothetical protein
MECVFFTLIIDDIVLYNGRTVMHQLGGGGNGTSDTSRPLDPLQ